MKRLFAAAKKHILVQKVCNFLGICCGALLLSVAPVLAAGDCILDNCVDRQPMPAQSGAQPGRPVGDAPADPQPARGGWLSGRGAGAPQGNFDFYILSLSWSPSFCALGGASRSRNQCASGANPGFVLHGLWPENANSYRPQCDGAAFLPFYVLNGLGDLYPDLGLAKHEWRAHGACSGKNPAGYFADVRAARGQVAIPPVFRAPASDVNLSPMQVQQAFIDANPRLRPGMLAVTCKSDLIQEVRVCLSKDLRDFVACPQVARSACRSQSMTVPAGR